MAANGDIKYARFPITSDCAEPADTSIQDGVAALFPRGKYDIISTQIVNITGGSGRYKSVLVVVGRRIGVSFFNP